MSQPSSMTPGQLVAATEARLVAAQLAHMTDDLRASDAITQIEADRLHAAALTAVGIENRLLEAIERELKR